MIIGSLRWRDPGDQLVDIRPVHVSCEQIATGILLLQKAPGTPIKKRRYSVDCATNASIAAVVRQAYQGLSGLCRGQPTLRVISVCPPILSFQGAIWVIRWCVAIDGG